MWVELVSFVLGILIGFVLKIIIDDWDYWTIGGVENP